MTSNYYFEPYSVLRIWKVPWNSGPALMSSTLRVLPRALFRAVDLEAIPGNFGAARLMSTVPVDAVGSDGAGDLTL